MRNTRFDARVLVVAMSLGLTVSVALAATCIYKGLTTTELGAATATIIGPNLVISNIGSSGNDGVRVDLPTGTEDYKMKWQDLGTAATTSTGVSIRASATGLVNGVRNQPLGSIQISDNGALLEATADYSPVGSATAIVEVYNGGVLQGSFGGMTGTLARMTEWPDGDEKKGFQSGTTTKCMFPFWNAPISIEIPGHGSFTGDQLALLIESPTATLSTISSFSLQAKDLATITVTDSVAVVATPPIPTLSQWGVLALALTLAGSAFLLLRRRVAIS